MTRAASAITVTSHRFHGLEPCAVPPGFNAPVPDPAIRLMVVSALLAMGDSSDGPADCDRSGLRCREHACLRLRGIPVPAACQKGAETTDIDRQPDGEETGPHQESGSWPPTSKRPCKRTVSGSNPLTGSRFSDLQPRRVPGRAGAHRKNQKQVKKLIAGPDAYICDGCVSRAHAVIAEPCRTAPTPIATIQIVNDEAGAERCSFCGKRRDQRTGTPVSSNRPRKPLASVGFLGCSSVV
jgi:hypothetical protein